MTEKKTVKQVRKKDRKQQIINSALKVFCEKGYDDAKIDDIVDRIGCSHGLFYHYFKSKKDLFQVAVVENDEKLKKLIFSKIDKLTSYREKLKLIIEGLYKELYNNENYARHFYLFISNSFSKRNKRRALPEGENTPINQPIAFMENLFREGQEKGEFSNKYTPRECTEMFVSILQGATLAYVIAPKDTRKTMRLPKIDFILDVYDKGENNG